MKKCTKCGAIKTFSEFYKTKKVKAGREASCKLCFKAHSKAYRIKNRTEVLKKQTERYRKNRLVILADMAKHYKENRAVVRAKVLERKYGLTLAAYQKLMAYQSGACAICGGSMKPAYVDHCHKTGKVRGLLCRPCNTALGSLHDSPEICRKAASYLENSPHSLCQES